MIFLIRYDRDRSERISLQRFQDSERAGAEQARFALELEIAKQKLNQEVVLLSVMDEAALRITHSRYFDDIDQMAAKLASSTSASVIHEQKD
jgi:hypothetical protein